jgi:hypothetical protein
MTTARQQVIEIIKEMPGLTASEIRELLSDDQKCFTDSALNYYSSRGALTWTTKPNPRAGRKMVRAYSLAPEGTMPVQYKRRKKASATPAGEVETIRLLREEIAELKAWKAAAITRYPDLAVDPAVLRARKIVADIFAKMGDPREAEHARAGKLDERPIMLAALAALEN